MTITRRDSLALGLGLAATACAPATTGAALEASRAGPASLDALARRSGRRFGSAVAWGAPGADRGSFANPAYAAILERECSLLVPENELKWQWTRRTPAFDFAQMDAIAGYATAKNFALRGHTLFWYPQKWYPEWLVKHEFGARPAAEAERLLTEHIRTAARRYGRRIYSYDVVNEAIEPQTGEIRDTVITRAMGGEAALGLMFHTAKAEAPHAELVYNDYMSWERGTEDETHIKGVLKLLEGFRKRGTPVHTLGIQSHIRLLKKLPVADIVRESEGPWRRFLDEVVSMGYRLVITEFDVNDQQAPDDIAVRDRMVADYSKAYLDLMLSYPQLQDILAWGMVDKYSWLTDFDPRRDKSIKRGTPYDSQFRPKPLRDAIAAAFAEARTPTPPSRADPMRKTIAAAAALLLATSALAQELKLNDKGYFARPGLNVMVFSDYYPEGHQTGVTVVQHGKRVAANGDLRLEPSPGQWSPVPLVGERTVDEKTQTVTQALSFPDPSKDRKGFNPVFYPKLDLGYKVRVTRLEGNAFRISVDLDRPVPREWVGKVGFNLELFPLHLWGKSFLLDGQSGIFPRQPNGPVVHSSGPAVEVPVPVQANGPVTSLNREPLPAPLGTGRRLVVAPDSDDQRMVIESRSGTLELIDGRLNHPNGWFIVRGIIPAGATANALEWVVTPHVEKDWKYEPVIQVSQVGYAPNQPKTAVIELDPADRDVKRARLFRLTDKGREEVLEAEPQRWGEFLRYSYRTFDFSRVSEPGMYVVGYGDKLSHPFKIGGDVYSRHVWQPTLEVFLPAQMCHMRVNQKYRVWHGHDHLDDALMAPTNLNHYDGYVQGPSTLTRYKPGQIVPGLDAGGWHDAGDYDMRIESQIGTIWLLAKMVEEFGLDYDATRIDQKSKLVEIHDPDGKSDAVQQIEHGLLSVMGGYRAMGRLYRGIIDPTHRQYVLLGQAENQTDNVFRKPVEGLGLDNAGKPIRWDDRWVFTEDNPDRELHAAAGLAAAARVMKASDPKFAAETLAAARDVAGKALPRGKSVPNKVFALAELIHATGDRGYVRQLLAMEADILANVEQSAWMLAPILGQLNDEGFRQRLDAAVAAYQATVKESARTDSPYGVPYKPDIWGAGWTIQERGVRQYFFHKGWPQHTDPQSWVNALNFVLGVHPGENNISFVSGVGANSATVAYGTNRADFSYIPGGVISGTALIRPDLPELKNWPFFWQQTEYVMGGGEANFMFLALAADRLYGKTARP